MRLTSKTPTPVTAGVHEMGDASPDTIASFLVAIRNPAGGFSATFRGEPIGGGAVSAASPQLEYADTAAGGTTTPGATAVAAAGNYRVTADGCAVGLHVTAGSATVTVVPLQG